MAAFRPLFAALVATAVLLLWTQPAAAAACTGEVENGRVYMDGNVTCLRFHDFVPDPSGLPPNCMNRKWTNLGSCQYRRTCPAPTLPPHMNISLESSSPIFGGRYHLGCNYGYKLLLGNSREPYLRCNASGHWTKHTAQCQPCEYLELHNGQVKRHGAGMQPVCNQGYHFSRPAWHAWTEDLCSPGTCSEECSRSGVTVGNGTLNRNYSVTCDAGFFYKPPVASNPKCHPGTCEVCPSSSHIPNGRPGLNCARICNAGYHLVAGVCKVCPGNVSNGQFGEECSVVCSPGYTRTPSGDSIECKALCPLPSVAIEPLVEHAQQNVVTGKWLYSAVKVGCPRGKVLKSGTSLYGGTTATCTVSGGVASFPDLSCKDCVQPPMIAGGSLNPNFSVSCNVGRFYRPPPPGGDTQCAVGTCPVCPSLPNTIAGVNCKPECIAGYHMVNGVCTACRRTVANGNINSASCQVKCHTGFTAVLQDSVTECLALCPVDEKAPIHRWRVAPGTVQTAAGATEYTVSCSAHYRLIYRSSAALGGLLIANTEGTASCRVENQAASIEPTFCTPCTGSVSYGKVSIDGRVTCEPGRRYVPSSRTASCSDTGSWLDLGRCECKQHIANAQAVSVNGHVTCQFGFYHSGTSPTTSPTCSAQGQWQNVGSCKACSFHAVGGTLNVTRRPVTISCLAGYEFTPRLPRTSPLCHPSGHWENIGQCSACPGKVEAPATFGLNCSVICQQGFSAFKYDDTYKCESCSHSLSYGQVNSTGRVTCQAGRKHTPVPGREPYCPAHNGKWIALGVCDCIHGIANGKVAWDGTVTCNIDHYYIPTLAESRGSKHICNTTGYWENVGQCSRQLIIKEWVNPSVNYYITTHKDLTFAQAYSYCKTHLPATSHFNDPLRNSALQRVIDRFGTLLHIRNVAFFAYVRPGVYHTILGQVGHTAAISSADHKTPGPVYAICQESV